MTGDTKIKQKLPMYLYLHSASLLTIINSLIYLFIYKFKYNNYLLYIYI